MPLTLPQKPKTLAQELKEKEQSDTTVRGTVDMPSLTKAKSLNASAQQSSTGTPKLSRNPTAVHGNTEQESQLNSVLSHDSVSIVWDALIPRDSAYLQPTNIAAIRELNNLGIDTSKINKEFFERNATLKQYASIGMNGLPLAPGAGSSREEKAAYYYVKLLNAENQTVRAETELAGLNREISYWASRKDRNYSDDEITKRIDWNKYPTLNVMREGLKRGRPVPLNRGVDFGGDTINGMLWSARNGKGSGSHTVDAVKYALGVGNTYHADPEIRAKLDPKNSAYNPYALGSTVDEAAEYFGVDTFNQDWFNKNKGILTSKNETAKRLYREAFEAEQFTMKAEAEQEALGRKIAIRLKLSAASGKADPDVILRNILKDSPSLIRMDEGRMSGGLASLTRPVNYRYEDIAAMVKEMADIQNRRMGAVKNSGDLTAAAQNEKRAVIAAYGTALRNGSFTKSLTSSKSILWEEGPAVAWNINTWYRPGGENKLNGLRLSPGGGGKPQQHPYDGQMTEWNALKAEASQLGLTDGYGIPTDQYYQLKGGRPDWMVKADEADHQRTIQENPPITPSAMNQSVQNSKAYGNETENSNQFFVNPLDELTKQFEANKQAIAEDYLRPRTAKDMESIAKAKRFDSIDEFLLSQSNTLVIDDYEQQKLRETLNEIWYNTEFKKLTEERDAKRFGYHQTLSETVREEWQREKLSSGYISPIFMESNTISGYNPKYMNKEEYATRLIRGDIKHWQGVYDGLKALESKYKDNTQWQYEMDVASHNLFLAQTQLEFFTPGFEGRALQGASDPQNPVANADKFNEMIKDVFNVGNDPKTALEKTIKETGMAYAGYLLGPEIKKHPSTLEYVMYPYEKDLFNSFWDPENPQKAMDYYGEILPSLEHRDKLYHQARNKQPNDLGTIVADAFEKPFANYETWVASIEALARGENITDDDPRYRDLQDVEQRRGEFVKIIGEKYPALKTLLNAGLSMADMGVAFLYSGGIQGMTFLMAQEAGSSTVLNTLERGGNIKTAITRGFASAAVEYFTERFGTGERFAKLFSNPVSTRSFLKEFLDSMIAEGVEEIPGWITDNLTDQMMGALSQESLRYTELYQQYLEENGGDQAKADQAANDQIGIEGFGQLFEQMLSAAIAGGFGSGVANIAGHINIDHAAQDILNNNPGLDPALANAIASKQTGWAPPKSILNQLVEKYQSGSAAQDRSVTNSGLNNTESGWTSVQATRTADAQEDTERNILPESSQTKDSDAPAENGNIQPPAQNDIEYMEQLESNKDYAGAANLRYSALMDSLKNSAAGVEALAADEGAVSMAAQMMMDAAMAQNSGTVIDAETRAMYEQAAQEVLGVKVDAITQFASFLNAAVNTTDPVSMGTGLTGALSTVVNMKDAALRQVLDAYVSGGNLDLPAAQTLYMLMQLREAVLGTASDADVIIKEALLQLTSDALKSADVNTGNPALDDALVAAASSPHNLHAIQELWGMDGVNYAVNLIQSDHVKEALLLAALPSYSRAVIVAEENMKNVTLNQDVILAQENAIA